MSVGVYQTMLAARQQDPVQLAEAYRDIPSLVLTIDGLQPVVNALESEQILLSNMSTCPQA